MKKTENIKVNYYFDEAGDPNMLGRKGVNLIEKGLASKVFMVGYFESKNPKELSKNLESLRQEIINDDYYKEIPSIKKTAKMFHATDDCQEVREKVFRLLKKSDFTFFCIVARKKEDLFRKKFDLQAADYVLWTIQRAYQNGDFRYYNYIKEKIALVHDIFDFVKYPKNYYTPKNPLEAKKIDPV